MTTSKEDVKTPSALKEYCINYKDPIEMIRERLIRNPHTILMYGESHIEEFGLKFQIEVAKLIASRGGKYVFLEEFETPSLQQLLTDFMVTGVMNQELEVYLTEGGLRHDFNMKHNHKLELIKTCREVGLTPIFMDDRNLRGIRGSGNIDKHWAEVIQDKLGNGNTVPAMVITGRVHSYKDYNHKATGNPTLASRLIGLYGRENVYSVPAIEVINGSTSNDEVFAAVTKTADRNRLPLGVEIDNKLGLLYLSKPLGLFANKIDAVICGTGKDLTNNKLS